MQPKSVGTAYVLWFFLGALGIHQFYLGKTARAVSMLLTFGWLTIGLWIDLFTLPGQVRKVNAAAVPVAV
ncbi:TM2 domain-containing protein [Micromonospora sp. NPDC007271]|uniref:TM2 domain-containing protein n=1 Tax=Micromonospora sp. NPDC007271 TaxID=3154587 RepID=UPI003406C8AA